MDRKTLDTAIGAVNALILDPDFTSLPAWAQRAIREADENLNGTRDGLFPEED